MIVVSVDKNSTVIFPALLMSTIQELGAFLDGESIAAGRSVPPAAPLLRPNGAPVGD